MTGYYETKEPLHAIPDASLYGNVPESGKWGGEGVYAWFKGGFTVAEGESVTYRFRLLFRRSPVTADGIEAQYQAYVH